MPDGTVKELCTNQEYHPFLFAQYLSSISKSYDTFNESVDEFYSNLESQKYDVKCMQQVCINLYFVLNNHISIILYYK